MTDTIKYLRYDTDNFILGENTVVMEAEIIELLQNKEDKNMKNVYIIGDLLGAPYYYLPLEISAFKDLFRTRNERKIHASFFPSFENTIFDKTISRMKKTDSFFEVMPQCLIEATQEYIEENNINETILEDLSKSTTILLHLRTGDAGDIDKGFFDLFKKVALNYEKIYIIFGIHNNHDENCKYTKGMQSKYWASRNSHNNIINSLQQVLELKNSIFLIGSSDIHISLMSCASNLFLHRGGFSTLGSIVCKGNIYYTKYFQCAPHEHNSNKNWPSLMLKLDRNTILVT